jgi:hypothetical protein
MKENLELSQKVSNWTASQEAPWKRVGILPVTRFSSSKHQSKNVWFCLVTFPPPPSKIYTIFFLIPVTISHYLLLLRLCWQFRTTVCCLWQINSFSPQTHSWIYPKLTLTQTCMCTHTCTHGYTRTHTHTNSCSLVLAKGTEYSLKGMLLESLLVNFLLCEACEMCWPS